MLPVNAPRCPARNNHHDGLMNFAARDEEVCGGGGVMMGVMMEGRIAVFSGVAAARGTWRFGAMVEGSAAKGGAVSGSNTHHQHTINTQIHQPHHPHHHHHITHRHTTSPPQ